jgi:hypothetical protein
VNTLFVPSHSTSLMAAVSVTRNVDIYQMHTSVVIWLLRTLTHQFKNNHSAEKSKFMLFAFHLISHRIMSRKKTISMKSYFLYEIFMTEVWSFVGTWHVYDGTRCHANCYSNGCKVPVVISTLD